MQQHDTNPQKSQRRLLPVTIWGEYHPWPSEAGLRYLIFNEHLNGFSHCVIRAGRRVLIDEEKFFEWVDKNGKTPQ